MKFSWKVCLKDVDEKMIEIFVIMFAKQTTFSYAAK